MEVIHRIKKLREKMHEKNINAYIIPSSDPHMSEYIASHWKGREWLSGFTGSAGTLVVTQDASGLWTDGRYFIQAERQLEGSGIKLFKMGMEGVPGYISWLADILEEGSCVGIDGRIFSISQVREMEKKFSPKGISLKKQYDLLVDIWQNRPSIPREPIFTHGITYSGKTVSQKIKMVRDEMSKKGVNFHLIPSLDDIAWLFNIRGNDVAYNPVAISYALVSNRKAWLFIDNSKVSGEIRSTLNDNGVEIEDYDKVDIYLSRLGKGDTILLDTDRTNSWLYESINSQANRVEGIAITTILKAVKNEVEIKSLKKAHVRDGVAMIKFLYWLDRNIGTKGLTEITIADKLEEFRSQQENYVGSSFPTIAGYRDHGAIVHYQATDESAYEIESDGMLLIDSGCHYLDGTTDITRTLVLGELTEQQKRDYTLVLKGNINLARARFLKGTTGAGLDILARKALWEQGMDYKHGTGHGVGHFLNVHEGPQGISQAASKIKLQKGMIVTNEPGIYREGQYGIRIENELLVVDDITTEFGEFLRFEPITYCPIALEALDTDLLDEVEKKWLNDYHQKVYDIISPFLDKDEKKWLKGRTRAI